LEPRDAVSLSIAGIAEPDVVRNAFAAFSGKDAVRNLGM
jgi:hypothetical protein